MPILSLAMPTPLRRRFDYLPPAELSISEINNLKPGTRIKAPFAGRQLTGILLAVKESSELPDKQLKTVETILDQEPALDAELVELGLWAAGYYQHPIGDVFSNMLPVLLRKGEAITAPSEIRWQLTTQAKGLPDDALKRAPKQAQLLALLRQHDSINLLQIQAAGLSRAIVRNLEEKSLIESIQVAIETLTPEKILETPLTLNLEQQAAVNQVKDFSTYQCFLLEGITGSGKTEVYLQLIQSCIDQQKQALLLIPEIGLTPQTLSRFQRRFNVPIALLHSGLNDKERLSAWQQARSGQAKIIIGTRSAIFTPLHNPGLIIVDEEHDSSFKQQDGFRYHARDIAIKRAHKNQCPVFLGSATPSLESLHNAQQQRYQLLPLKQRATGASSPRYQILDIRHANLTEGFSDPLLKAIKQTVEDGNQVLVFINRRGFAPMLMCHDCGWCGQCKHCDARLTVHFQQRLLRCHHCDSQQTLPHHCPDCNSTQLEFRGPGTERSELTLKHLFPHLPVIRIDRDTTSRKTAMHDLLSEVNTGKPCILIGTQMLAKGHHFPDVTLVAVLDADGGLFSADFRGPERMGQLLEQVAGRAGREAKPGTVMVQTHQPEHPFLNHLIDQGYSHFARQLLQERKQTGLPPYTYLALLRAEANNLEQPHNFLLDLRRAAPSHDALSVFGPLPAPMTKKAGRFRAQLLIQSQHRGHLHQVLTQLCTTADDHPLAKRVRWSIDVDPVDMF